MSADTLLSHLSGVKKTGPDRWLALCPSHNDKNPSLSIRECEDSRILLKCWAGCDVESILIAMGLGWDAIMPSRAFGDHVKRERKPFNALDILIALENECIVVSLMALDIAKGVPLDEEARERALLASRRIRAAVDMANEHA